MNVKNTCNFLYTKWVDPEIKCKELPLGNHQELNWFSLVHRSRYTRFWDSFSRSWKYRNDFI